MHRSQPRFISLLPLLLFVLLVSCSHSAVPSSNAERAQRYTTYFDEADLDKSGVLEPAEINAVAIEDFNQMDYNKDGNVTIEDIYNPEQGGPEGATQNTDLSDHLPYDTNNDNVISLNEYRDRLDTDLIGEIDTSSDGQITLAEYSTYWGF